MVRKPIRDSDWMIKFSNGVLHMIDSITISVSIPISSHSNGKPPNHNQLIRSKTRDLWRVRVRRNMITTVIRIRANMLANKTKIQQTEK